MVPWGEDAHLLVCESLSWVDLAKLKCVNRVYHAITRRSTAVNPTVWWGQAQSTEQDIEELVPSLIRQRKVGAYDCCVRGVMFARLHPQQQR